MSKAVRLPPDFMETVGDLLKVKPPPKDEPRKLKKPGVPKGRKKKVAR